MGIEESRIKNDVLRHFGTRDEIRIWNNPSGMGRAMNDDHPIRFGLKGSSDIIGIIGAEPLRGKWLAIETKTEVGRQSKEQINFMNMIRAMGGIYIIARSVHDVYAALFDAGLELQRVKVGV